MRLVSKFLTLLSSRLSLLAAAGIAILVLLPDHRGSSASRSDQAAPVEPARLVAAAADAEVTIQQVAAVSRRSSGRKKAAKAEFDPKNAVKGRDVPATPGVPDVDTRSVSLPPLPEQAPPPPDVWSEAQVIEGLRECIRLLAPIAAEIEVAEPLKKGECGTPAPVELRSIGTTDKVRFRPGVPLNCRMVVALHKWVEKDLQPAAREILGSPVTRISGGSYSCRNRYGLPDAAISEHAFANAIDIASFSTADGRTVNVLKHWGLTARDIEAQRLATAKAKAKAAQSAGANGAKKAVLPKDPEGRDLPQQAVDRPEKDHELRTAQMKLGAKSPPAPASKAKAIVPAPSEPPSRAEPPPEERFLHELHRSACGQFSTVLGPEANDAHRNHFHLDLARRRSKRSYCR